MRFDIRPSLREPHSANAIPVPNTRTEANATRSATLLAPSASSAEASTAAEEEVALTIATRLRPISA